MLRLGGKDTELLGIDREAEHAAARTAAGLGIGPDVVDLVRGCLVTRFVPGTPVGTEPRDIARVGAVLRRLHDGPAIPARFNSFRVVETYLATAREHDVPEPAQYAWAHEVAARIEGSRGAVAPVPCHNDLLNANFVAHGDELRIVDWEYAGMGDPFFDLANFAVNHELDEDGDRALLASYGSDDERALTLMRFMSDFREAMWGVVQQGISALDVDFRAYADEHFARLERTAASASFERALAAAENG